MHSMGYPDCKFCRIVEGRHSAVFVWENSDFLAFLDWKPINPGHTLLIPKSHIDYLFDLDSDKYLAIFDAARDIEIKLRERTNALRIGVAVKGFQVAHAHVHLVPLYGPGELDFSNRSECSHHDLEMAARSLGLCN